MRGTALFSGVILAILFPVAAAAQDAPAEAESKSNVEGLQVQIFIENDSWRRSDRHYTNGLKLGVGVDDRHVPKEVRNVYRGLFDLLPWKRSDEQYYGLFLGQTMYTPSNISIATPQTFDRPWAGWLYLGLVGQRVHKGSGSLKDPDLLDTLEVDAGVVGPAAGAGEIQAWWHRQVNAPHPEGWANQLSNEPAFMAGYLHKRRYGTGNDGWDFIPHAGVSLGTVMSFVRAGGIVRYGMNKTGFGPDVIEPGGAMLQSTRRRYDRGQRENPEWFIFGGVDARLVGYNIFLDGTVFNDGPSVDRHPFVYDVLAGVSVRLFGFLRMSLTSVERSEEFTTPRGGGGRQRFHSINFGFEF